MRQHRGNKVSIVCLLYVSVIYLQAITLLFHISFTTKNQLITIESYDSTTLRRWELSTAPSDYIFQYNFRLAWYKFQEGNFYMAVPLS